MRHPLALRLPQRWAPYLFVAPFFMLFAVFGAFPLAFSLVMAFHSWEPTGGLAEIEFVGWGNFAFALEDEWFWKSLRNTLWLALISGLPQHLAAIPLAVFIHNAFPRWRDAVSGAYFLPYITSTVAIAILFSALFSKDFGLVNATLGAVTGLGPVDWLNEPAAIQATIAFVVFWRFIGFNVVLYLAALQTIPRDLYEAAAMDGASPWRQFWHITLPGLRPMIYFGVLLSVIGGLQLFDEPFILTGGRGGTDQAGMTSAVYLYRMAFDFNDFGGAAAMSWLLCGVVLLLTLATHRILGARRSPAS